DPVAELARARAQFHGGDFGKALVAFRRLSYELSPTDPELAEVKYNLAECAFQTGDRVQAAHDFRQVADQFPASPYAPLALLRAGDANLRLWRKPELDPSYGESALAIYQELAGRYPGTDAAARAQVHVQQLREWFAEKDYKNGMFYFRRRAFDSAIIYFKDVIANYQGTVREALDATIRFLPVREQPLKPAGHAPHGASPEQRAEMLELAVAGNPRFTVERIELTLPTPSYTVRTLRALAQREPGNRFTLL